jgi:aminobenzoyl-glutamate utilization protein B
MKKILLLAFVSLSVFAQDADKKKVLARIQQQESHYSAIAQKIWNFAEVGYKEKQSSALLQETLKQ